MVDVGKKGLLRQRNDKYYAKADYFLLSRGLSGSR